MARSKQVRSAVIAPAPPASQEQLLEARAWQGVVYRPFGAGTLEDARALFAYAAVWVSPPSPGQFGWGAWQAERLVGALVLETQGGNGMIHGPVVVDHPDPLEGASQLVAATLPHATALGVHTLFTRPQGLDRVWIRFGFIPVPEVELPKRLRGRPGSGLFAWRGGSALWSSRSPRPDELDNSR